MKKFLALLALLSGCSHSSILKLNEYGLGPADTALIDLTFRDVKYDGSMLEGRVELYAMEDVDVPNILGWKTLILDRAWTCDTHEDIGLAHVDYAANPDDRQDVLRLRKGDIYGGQMNFPVSLAKEGGPNCIRYEIVYAPDGQFHGNLAIKVAGTAKREPTAPSP
ncbi:MULTISPECIES: hypothetical protein [Corallococcus]|uniref:hypothetical protein n=1 Tax=Corallococcus TaxID=83461 RepID=UPI00118165CC|nr:MULTISPECIES: hypothetical protein [Corallococcus]NBD10404.1 hypothetical protein [Corallococcus silvisoli]TSC27619.1 hypothetical protein FOF48_19600 [Corallococcus sp. Z5C101001]